MTAIREIDVGRKRTVFVSAPLGLGQTRERDPRRLPQRSRRMLAMCWRVTPEGSLACRWQTDISAAFGLPPD